MPWAQRGFRPPAALQLCPCRPSQVRRLLKKQVVRVMSCSPDTQCPRDHSTEDPDKKGEPKTKSEPAAASPEGTPETPASPVEMREEGVEEPAEAGQRPPPFLLKEGGDDRLHSEQDADDEAADDTDDTSSVTSSASSTASSQSGSGTGRKKSIPLSIKNLKRKHKRKKNKISRDFKPGDR